jgi:hypothetical protein
MSFAARQKLIPVSDQPLSGGSATFAPQDWHQMLQPDPFAAALHAALVVPLIDACKA